MKYEILFYEQGNICPVEKFIQTLQKSTQAKFLKILDLLQLYGVSIGIPYVKKINTILWEIRVRGTEEVRILFLIRQSTITILHGFRKKQNKIHAKDIKIAMIRSFKI